MWWLMGWGAGDPLHTGQPFILKACESCLFLGESASFADHNPSEHPHVAHQLAGNTHCVLCFLVVLACLSSFLCLSHRLCLLSFLVCLTAAALPDCCCTA